MSLTFQISHAELLLLLGLLELPRPFALGPSVLPERPVLEGVVGAAVGSLAARDLLKLPAQADHLPTPHAGLATLLRTAALADSLMIVASGPPTRLSHISRAGENFVLHSSPVPDIHRFAALPDVGHVIDTMLAMVMPENIPEPVSTEPLMLDGEGLLTAFNALQHDDLDTAARVFQRHGHTPVKVRPLIEMIGSQPTRHALAAIRQLRQPHSEARGAIVVAGRYGGWWVAPAPDRDDLLALWPIGGPGLRVKISEFGAWICEAA
ncbi:hypothetical protein [Chloroflexus sp.]|uniref:hypothetical protein n=1 Tax=Chloroflexus sp. TaxID=1904827 RepID=UPI00404A4EFB